MTTAMTALIDALAGMAAERTVADARARQEEERRAKVDEVIARHGSREAVFAEGRDEAAMRAACEPFVEAGRLHRHFAPDVGKMPPEMVAALREAVPMPGTVAAALAAYDALDARASDRYAVNPDWEPPVHAECWRRLLKRHLDTLPAVSFADVLARAEWMQRVLDFGISRDVAEDQACLDALKEDLRAIGERRIAVPRRKR